MASPSLSRVDARDPVLYRIKVAEHHQTGIGGVYPMSSCISDALEALPYAMCTSTRDNRRLYGWVLDISIPGASASVRILRLNLASVSPSV